MWEFTGEYYNQTRVLAKPEGIAFSGRAYEYDAIDNHSSLRPFMIWVGTWSA